MRESGTTSTIPRSAGTRDRSRRMPPAPARRTSAFPTRLAGSPSCAFFSRRAHFLASDFQICNRCSGRVARTSRAAAEVVDGITLRQRRDMILGSPRLPLLRESLHQPRLFAGKIFLLGAIALHVVEFPGPATKRGQLVASLAD